MNTVSPSIPKRPVVLIGHSRDCAEIAHAILLERDVDIVLFQEDLVETFKEHGIPHKVLWDFLTPAQRERSVTEGTYRAVELPERIKKSKAFVDRFGEEGAASIADRLFERVRYDFPNETLTIDALRACASSTDLRLVIVPQDVARDMRTLTMAAQRLGIPVIHQLHGYPCGSFNLTEDVYTPHVAAYSESAAEIYRGFGADRVEITGNPHWDQYLRPPEPSLRERALEISGLNGEAPIVLCVLSYPYNLSEAGVRNAEFASHMARVFIEALEPICQEHRDLQIVMRPHPNWDDAIPELKSRIEESALNTVWIDRELPVIAAVALADLVVCTESNFAIEALMQGVPAINVNIESYTGEIFSEGLGSLLRDNEAICSVTSEAEVEPAIRSLLFDDVAREGLLSNRRETLSRFTDTLIPNATQRFAKYAAAFIDEYPQSEQPLRYESIEQILIELVSKDAKTIYPLTDRDEFVDVLSAACTNAEVSKAPGADCVVIAKPIGENDADETLQHACDLAADDGYIVFYANHLGQRDAEVARATGRWAPERPGYERADAMHGFTVETLNAVLAERGLEAVVWRPVREVSVPYDDPRDLAHPSIFGWGIQARRKAE